MNMALVTQSWLYIHLNNILFNTIVVISNHPHILLMTCKRDMRTKKIDFSFENVCLEGASDESDARL